jgi:hypothetical protein
LSFCTPFSCGCIVIPFIVILFNKVEAEFPMLFLFIHIIACVGSSVVIILQFLALLPPSLEPYFK